MRNPSTHHRLAGLAAALLLAGAVAACSSSTTSTPAVTGTLPPGTTGGSTPGTAPGTGSYAVFNGQANNLDAYEPAPPFTTQRVISTVADEPDGMDINAQICFFPDGSNRFIAGEDTGQKAGDRQGWGIFQLEGTSVGTFSATEVAKLVPTYQGSADNAENYGCGFLPDGRIVTTDVGNQALGPADGQLIVWFPPYDSEQVRYCKIDTHIATAQSIWVDPQDRVWVASARPGADGDTASGVFRYDGPFPTSDDASGGCGAKDATGAPMAEGITPTKVIPSGEHGMLSPSGLAPAPDGNLYVSSVASGVIAEFRTDGTFVRTILEPPAGETLGAKPFSTGTPLGIGVGPDGTLFYADIGIVIDPKDGYGPGPGTGTVRRITFVGGEPQAPETMATGLEFPDGIGIYVPPAGGVTESDPARTGR
jgi:sugar lactone lactonase YvrE